VLEPPLPHPPGSLDERVLALVAAGDRGAAAAAILHDLGPGLLGYLSAILRDDDDGREVLAATAEQLLTAVGRFRGDSAVRTWTYRIAWRTAMRFRDDPHRRRRAPLDTGVVEQLPAGVRSSTAVYQRTETRDWLARARSELSIEDQSLLTLRLDRDMSWTEVATVMGAGDATSDIAALRKRYERIKARLRRSAERDGVIPS
jgi:RNA polymerase sigma-70 factor (ECF subfamily)